VTPSKEHSGGEDSRESGVEACGSLRQLANWGTAYLEKRGVPNARNNAEWILCDATDCDRLQIYVDTSGEVVPDQRERYLDNLRRRAGREPLQYILGTTEFMSLPFRTPRGVFVPRPFSTCAAAAGLSRFPWRTVFPTWKPGPWIAARGR